MKRLLYVILISCCVSNVFAITPLEETTNPAYHGNATTIQGDDVRKTMEANAVKANDNFDELVTSISGKANAVGTLNYTASAAPSASDILNNKYITNYGATGTIAITLPAVSYEICRGLITESAQVIQGTPPTGEAFDLSGTALSADQSFAGPATTGAKAVVCRQRNAAGVWIWSIDVVRGTWGGI